MRAVMCVKCVPGPGIANGEINGTPKIEFIPIITMAMNTFSIRHLKWPGHNEVSMLGVGDMRFCRLSMGRVIIARRLLFQYLCIMAGILNNRR